MKGSSVFRRLAVVTLVLGALLSIPSAAAQVMRGGPASFAIVAAGVTTFQPDPKWQIPAPPRRSVTRVRVDQAVLLAVKVRYALPAADTPVVLRWTVMQGTETVFHVVLTKTSHGPVSGVHEYLIHFAVRRAGAYGFSVVVAVNGHEQVASGSFSAYVGPGTLWTSFRQRDGLEVELTHAAMATNMPQPHGFPPVLPKPGNVFLVTGWFWHNDSNRTLPVGDFVAYFNGRAQKERYLGYPGYGSIVPAYNPKPGFGAPIDMAYGMTFEVPHDTCNILIRYFTSGIRGQGVWMVRPCSSTARRTLR